MFSNMNNANKIKRELGVLGMNKVHWVTITGHQVVGRLQKNRKIGIYGPKNRRNIGILPRK